MGNTGTKGFLKGLNAKDIASKYTTYIIFIVLFTGLGILTGFDSWRLPSLQNLVIAEAIRAFAALGVGIIIITRGISIVINNSDNTINCICCIYVIIISASTTIIVVVITTITFIVITTNG